MQYLRMHIEMYKLLRSSMSQQSTYIDPLAGSVILQVILGGVAGVGVAMKMYWHRVSAFFGRGSNDTDAGK